MTPEAQRIAIAEACGWKNIVTNFQLNLAGTPPSLTSMGGHGQVPDYLADLDAMHEAEKVLTFDQWQTVYTTWLRTLRGEALDEWQAQHPDERTPAHFYFGIDHATAAQRAEAFLRTLNLYTQ